MPLQQTQGVNTPPPRRLRAKEYPMKLSRQTTNDTAVIEGTRRLPTISPPSEPPKPKKTA
uniref:hypothetical protein n=1 Tax=Escherichia coli TaxID=562 RepID=UPI002F9072F7